MKKTISLIQASNILLLVLLSFMAGGCIPYMKMNPPADSDKPTPISNTDLSCWMHAASNMLAGAGYGTGTTLQARADNIFSQMSAHYGTADGGWIDAALQWWLGSANNIWTTNPYTVVTVMGNKNPPDPWTNTSGPKDMGNYLRTCDLLGISTSVPTGGGGIHGHAITGWGDNISGSGTLTVNPSQIRLTDSDNDTGGNVQAYTYDTYTNPNPGGPNEGNGWYINYGIPHRYIKNIVTLSRSASGAGANSVMVKGSYKIHQKMKNPATDLHYQVGTDVNILTYRTWLDWEGTPAITEAQPRQSITVDWNLSEKPVPYCTWITINTEFVEQSWNSISYQNVHFTYPGKEVLKLPDFYWKIETPPQPKAEAIPNVTGGYIIGSFDIYDPGKPEEPLVHYRLVHQYLYNQSPESHVFTMTGAHGLAVRNMRFTHSYGYPSDTDLWKVEKWMTVIRDTTMVLSDKPVKVVIDWKGKLPYPEGDK